MKYSSTLYSKSCIDQGITSYKNLCDIKVQYDTEQTVCRLSNGKVNLELTAMEFSNYLIEIMNSRSSR